MFCALVATVFLAAAFLTGAFPGVEAVFAVVGFVTVAFVGALVTFAGPVVGAVLTGRVAARVGAGPCSSSYSVGRAATPETGAGLPQMSSPSCQSFGYSWWVMAQMRRRRVRGQTGYVAKGNRKASTWLNLLVIFELLGIFRASRSIFNTSWGFRADMVTM